MTREEMTETADERLAASLISCGYAEKAEEAATGEAKRSNTKKKNTHKKGHYICIMQENC